MAALQPMYAIGRRVTMTSGDFLTSLPLQWAILELFLTHIAPSDTLLSHWEKKQVPKQTFQLSPTLPTNKWFRRVSNPGWLLHHDMLPSPIEKGHPSTAPVPHAPPTTWPPPKPPDYCYAHNMMKQPTTPANCYQGLQSFPLAISTSTATSHTISASLAYINNHQQYMIHGIHSGLDPESKLPTEQQPLEVWVATQSTGPPWQPVTSTSPTPIAHHGHGTSPPLASPKSTSLPAEMTGITNQDYYPELGAQVTSARLPTTTHRKAVQKPPQTEYHQPPSLKMQDFFFSTMERTLADM